MAQAGPVITLSPRFAERQRQRRREILAGALRAFRETGYHATTLDHIARKVGLKKTALYHYFPDKESILFECHRTALAQLARLLGRAGQRYVSPAEQLRYIIREHVLVMTETLEGSPSAFEVSSLSPEHQRSIIAGRDGYEHALRRIISDGIACGEFRPVDPKIATFVILGAINWVARWYRPDGESDPEALGRDYADYLVGGLSCR